MYVWIFYQYADYKIDYNSCLYKHKKPHMWVKKFVIKLYCKFGSKKTKANFIIYISVPLELWGDHLVHGPPRIRLSLGCSHTWRRRPRDIYKRQSKRKFWNVNFWQRFVPPYLICKKKPPWIISKKSDIIIIIISFLALFFL